MQLNETEKRVLATLAVTLRERFSASEVLLYGSAARDELTDVDPELDSLRNCNSPEDYRAALDQAGLGATGNTCD